MKNPPATTAKVKRPSKSRRFSVLRTAANATDEPRTVTLARRISEIHARQLEIVEGMRGHRAGMDALETERTALLSENETAAKELQTLLAPEAFERLIKPVR